MTRSLHAARFGTFYGVLAPAVLGLPCSCATPTPTARATQTELLQCAANDERDVRTIEGLRVLSVEPVYSYMHNGRTGSDQRIKAVRLLVRPPSNVTPQALVGDVQCHSAHMVLGRQQSSRIENDPFWLPGAWLDIALEPDGANCALTITAEGIDPNLQILRLARAFASAHSPLAGPAAGPAR